MTETKHTPVPLHWGVDTWNDGFSGLYDSNDEEVYVPLCRHGVGVGSAWFLYDPNDEDAVESAVNYQLLEMAPDLHDALAGLVDLVCRSGDGVQHHAEYINAVALLAKARAV